MSGDAAGWRFERLEPCANLDEVLAIERASFATPWTWYMFAWELEHGPTSRVYVLREAGGAVRAFCTIWLVADELHVNNLAVAPAWRRQGLGRQLLERVLAEGVAEGASEATLEVRRSNAAALRLYAQLGFAVAGIRRHYYTNPVEDALILWKRDLQHRDNGAVRGDHGPPRGAGPAA